MPAAALDARPRRAPFGVPIAVSLALHAVVLGAFLLLRAGAPPPSPPVYRVNLVAAPPGPRAAGVVRQQPAPTPPAPIPVRPRSEA
ncbi:MAG TPA: hypothetical protein VJU87_09870, partial [Gemmatimonadaceae bacterium]|nr:hypothetical protein [Gemmatimonadaceae bacterium]